MNLIHTKHLQSGFRLGNKMMCLLVSIKQRHAKTRQDPMFLDTYINRNAVCYYQTAYSVWQVKIRKCLKSTYCLMASRRWLQLQKEVWLFRSHWENTTLWLTGHSHAVVRPWWWLGAPNILTFYCFVFSVHQSLLSNLFAWKCLIQHVELFWFQKNPRCLWAKCRTWGLKMSVHKPMDDVPLFSSVYCCPVKPFSISKLKYIKLPIIIGNLVANISILICCVSPFSIVSMKGFHFYAAQKSRSPSASGSQTVGRTPLVGCSGTTCWARVQSTRT